MDSRLGVNELLKEHFDTAFAAPDGIKKLRKLILTLAMQGKLVEQDPNDPPASELLKAIEAEKQRLQATSSPRRRGSSAEKKLNSRLRGNGSMKIKSLPPIKPEKVPYELPRGWEWVRFPEIYFGIGNKQNQIQTKDYLEAGRYPIIDQGKSFIAGYYEDGSRLLHIDQPVVIFGDHTRNIKYVDFDFVIGADGVKILCPYSPIFARFLYFLIQSFVLIDRGYARHFKLLNEKLAPIPPVSEQHRIVAKIDQLMAKCDELEKLRKEREEKRRAVHAAAVKQLLDSASSPAQPLLSPPRRWGSSASDSLDSRLRGNDGIKNAWGFIQQHFGELYTIKENVAELRKAILQLAIVGRLVPQDPNDPPASELLKAIEAEKQHLVKSGKIRQPKPLSSIKPEEVPYELPRGWEWVRLGEICSSVTSGSTPPSSEFREDEGIPFIKVYNIRNQRVDFEYKRQFVTEGYASTKIKRSMLYPGDVLMNIVGPPLGKVAIVPDEFSVWNCNQAIVVFRPLVKELNSFIYQFLCAGEFLNRIVLIGTAGQDNISLTKSMNIEYPLPPLPEQRRIVAKIDQLMVLCDKLEQQIDAATGKQTDLLNAVVAQV